eukprot:3878902-Pleurochrysis_carterae.AAC.2
MGADFGYTSLMNTLTRPMLKKRLPSSKRRLVRGFDVRCLPRSIHLFLSKRLEHKGGSKNVDYFVHALHAILVQRLTFQGSLWARLSSDHSQEEIGRLFSITEDFLKFGDLLEFGSVLEMIDCLHSKLLATKYSRMRVRQFGAPPYAVFACYYSSLIELHVVSANYVFTETHWFEGRVNCDKIRRHVRNDCLYLHTL